jgi:Methyltransferase domain
MTGSSLDRDRTRSSSSWSSSKPTDVDPDSSQVDEISFVLFLPDGRCALPQGEDGMLTVPVGAVENGEDYVLDSSLRIPLMTAGFRRQRFHPFALAGTHLFAWVEGDVYSGRRPHVRVPLVVDTPEAMLERLAAQSHPELAAILLAAVRSHRAMSKEEYYSDNRRLLEPAYLRADSPEGGSGFGGGARQWRRARIGITEGINSDGTFLDVGCANGLLMESVHRWCAERGVRVEPFGVELAPGLVELARRRLPCWADRIWLGNAIDWVHAGGTTFDYVHTLLACVPLDARRRLIEHQLARVVRPGGRLIVSHYLSSDSGDRSAGDVLEDLGYVVAGASPSDGSGVPPQTAWIDAPR